MEVGANLRQYRIRAGLSQESLGAKVGVTFQQVQKYEKGTNAIATARLPAICQALNISPNDLYGVALQQREGSRTGTAAEQLRRQIGSHHR
jgi:transcriptional regulator with XRE-family HTH domain